MATNGIRFALVLVTLAAVMYSTATAQSGCTSALMSLSPCLNYVSGNTSSPSTSCCSQLSGVVSSQPQCLCQLVNGGGSSLGITINQTRALGLPSACKVNTPSASRCSGSNVPSNSPGSSNGSPKTPATGSTQGSPSDGDSRNTVPTTTETSAASFRTVGKLFLVVVASCASGFVGL